ncbi:hypothetical protein R2R32_14175 [Clostridium perfringens]|nr:hypothetical protein [Clostridium perfringens]
MLEKKEDVIKRLEALVYTSDIKACDMLAKSLSEEFYAIGFAGKELNTELYDRFKKARNAAQETRKVCYGRLKRRIRK